ncbi:MAG TPA: methyltransferase domain-containing protein [Nitrospira sp.]|nr:methyltransferase domain-containing protein [Nitrospira sp.]
MSTIDHLEAARRPTARDWSRAMLQGMLQRWLTRWRSLSVWPPVGRVQFGSLRRTTPISRLFGLDRGARERCIDIVFIERFLNEHQSDIHGHVLEIGDDRYTRRFGGANVDRSDVLHVRPGDHGATIVADLTAADAVASESFDCIICTQTLQFIYDVHAAVRTLHRILRPGGVLLASFTGISQISRYDMDRWGDYWRFTTASARRLFEACWPADHVIVKTQGNALLAVAYLHGLTVDDLRPEEMEAQDDDFQLVITVRAVKPHLHEEARS